MSADALYSVTQALRDRLSASLADIGGGDVFVGPLDDPAAKGAALILFLYRIAPHASLRNDEHIVISSGPPAQVITYTTSLPLTLHYLITIGTRDGAEDPMLRLLGHAMRALNDDTELSGVKVGNEVLQISLEPLSTEEMSRIWTLFPTANYRTSVAYVVTPVWIDPKDPPTAAAPVTSQTLRAGSKPVETADG
jgi:hypothetical protein